MPDPAIAYPADQGGGFGILHLERFWSRLQSHRRGVATAAEAGNGDNHRDRILLDALGLGQHQVLQFLYANTPTLAEFEQWITSTSGEPLAELVSRLNGATEGGDCAASVSRWLRDVESRDAVLTDDELTAWEEDGFVIVRNSVSAEACAAAEKAIWEHVRADPGDPRTWYTEKNRSIMVELIQHPALEECRRSPRIHKAFSQLWRTADLWVSADRCGFHVPESPGFPFPGPDLHWDVDFSQPPHFATQGILYLTDTPPDQGAFTLVPGFHRRLEQWLRQLPPGADPQGQDLQALGSRPIAGKAGDLIIWNHALPHGSRPNTGCQPRIVQYINMYPSQLPASGSWLFPMEPITNTQ